MNTYLERIEPATDCFRFYKVLVVPTLFGEWAVVKEWGRIGQGGTVRDVDFATMEEAVAAGSAVVAAKRRRGYRVRSDCGAVGEEISVKR